MPNFTYVAEMVSRQPFGWEYTQPFAVDGYWFEEIDPFYWHSLFIRNWALPFIVGPIYVGVIFGLQRFMRDRPAYQLKMPLFYWNLALGIFSVFGLARTFPAFSNMLSKPGGFYTSICEKKYADVASGFWGLMFALSKIIELGDSVFIVLRKRPLVLLQWYHHVATMTVSWLLSPYLEPVSRWYMVMNYAVHSLMYPYFAARGIGVRVPNSFANLITTLQLAQMIMALGVNLLSMYFHMHSGYDCQRYPISIKLFSVVYGSFILLFGKLFYDAVIKSGRNRKEKNSKKVE